MFNSIGIHMFSSSKCLVHRNTCVNANRVDASYKNAVNLTNLMQATKTVCASRDMRKTDKNQVDMIFASNNESNEHNFLCFIRRITSECFLHECLNNFTSLTIRSCIHAGCRLHRFAFLFFQCKKKCFLHIFFIV